MDALGNTVKVQDSGGTVTYSYFANSSLKSTDYGGNVISATIDGWGRKTTLNDPATGTYTYSYNIYGELLEETTPKGATVYEYDEKGKLVTMEMTGDQTDYNLTYTYDPLTKMLKKIDGLDNLNSRIYTYEYEYNTYQQPWKIKENTGLAEFELVYDYDTYGRVQKETQISKNLTKALSSTVKTRNVYDVSEILSEIWNEGTPDKPWELGAINTRGQALTVKLGNGMVQTKVYDSYGYSKIEDKESGTDPIVALHMEYNFNAQRGTLNSRKNFSFNWQENFAYDQLDQLTTISGGVVKTMAFDTKGRITNNSGIGAYTYDNTKKYRLKDKDIVPNAAGEVFFQEHPTQQITYNAFKKPVDIHEAGHGRVSFEYGPMMNRSHAYYGGEVEDKAMRRYGKHYSAIISAEIEEDTQTGSVKLITYVGGDAYSAPIVRL